MCGKRMYWRIQSQETWYKTVEEFLADLRKKFEREDEEAVKVAELKRLEQEGKTMEKFVMA